MPDRSDENYVVAVSGGVDSVVLLDALARGRLVAGQHVREYLRPGKLIVAHFDHGIRDDSADDARFVEALAAEYGLPYFTERKELGKQASEEIARHYRYEFLRCVAKEHQARVVTAHHANDIVESIAINIARGTGWRGVAVMDTKEIARPLLGVTKHEIQAYATENDLTWHEDSTNSSDDYLRNRLRKRIDDDDIVWQAVALRAQQCELRRQIDDRAAALMGSSPYSRYFFTHCGDTVAIELLRTLCIAETGASPAPPMRQRMLHAIKVARAGTTLSITKGVSLAFTRTHFVVQTTR